MMPKPASNPAGEMEISEEYAANSVSLRLSAPFRCHSAEIHRFFEVSNLNAIQKNCRVPASTAVAPPSATKVVPVTNEASSEARNATAPAISSG